MLSAVFISFSVIYLLMHGCLYEGHVVSCVHKIIVTASSILLLYLLGTEFSEFC